MTDLAAHRSVWLEGPETDPSELATALPPDDDTEVCVIGGGIAGLTTAYCLAQEGKRVVVLDRGAIGGGETARTTAHLSCALDDRFFRLEALHGERAAQLAAASHMAAIDWIEDFIGATGVDCDFRRLDGHLFLAPGQNPALLQWELEAAGRAGVVCDLIPELHFGDQGVGPAIRFPRQAQFHPMKYLAGLARAAALEGVNLHANAAALEIVPARGRHLVKVAGGRSVLADTVVVATNTPINNRFALHTKQAAYRTYVIAVPVPPGTLSPGLYWDAAEPYHYVRAAGDLLIVGGEDHKVGQDDHPERRWEALEAWIRARVAAAGPVEYRWSGQIMEPVDSLAFIGRNPGDESVYVATGDSGHGLTHGTIAGMLLGDLICGRKNPWTALYDPRRSALRALPELARENLNAAAQYASWLAPSSVRSIDEIPRGSGAILRRGFKRIAVYRDEQGRTEALSAACPHLGGVVSWNAAEKTWDCPCHGSRFDARGRVLNGPAVSNLEPASLDDDSDDAGDAVEAHDLA